MHNTSFVNNNNGNNDDSSCVDGDDNGTPAIINPDDLRKVIIANIAAANAKVPSGAKKVPVYKYYLQLEQLYFGMHEKETKTKIIEAVEEAKNKQTKMLVIDGKWNPVYQNKFI